MSRSVPSSIRVFVAHGHSAIRGALVRSLDDSPALTVVGHAANVDETLDLVTRLRADVVLVDLLTEGLLRGADLVDRILSAEPDTRVVVIGTVVSPGPIADAVRSGAVGFALRNASIDDLIGMIIDLAHDRRAPDVRGGAIVEFAQYATKPIAEHSLTSREAEVLQLVARGMANKEIAVLLGLAEGTVKTHMKSVMAKLGAASRTHAAVIAISSGFVTPDSVS